MPWCIYCLLLDHDGPRRELDTDEISVDVESCECRRVCSHGQDNVIPGPRGV